VRRSTHEKQQIERYGFSMLDTNCAYTLITNVDDLRTVKEAIEMHDSNSWLEAMNEEMASLKKKFTLYYSEMNYIQS
jgi:hypothetical protein